MPEEKKNTAAEAAEASRRGRKSRAEIEEAQREKASQLLKKWERVIAALTDAETKVETVLATASKVTGSALPEGVAVDIVADAVTKVLASTQLSEKAIWEAV